MSIRSRYAFIPWTTKNIGRNFLKGVPFFLVTSRQQLLAAKRRGAKAGYRPHQGAQECARRRPV